MVADKTLELCLQKSRGIPEGSLVSIRVGKTRRQAPVESDRPFSFPSAQGQQQVKIDIYAPVASTRIPFFAKGTSEVTVSLESSPQPGIKKQMVPEADISMSFKIKHSPHSLTQSVHATPRSLEEPAEPSDTSQAFARITAGAKKIEFGPAAQGGAGGRTLLRDTPLDGGHAVLVAVVDQRQTQGSVCVHDPHARERPGRFRRKVSRGASPIFPWATGSRSMWE